MKQTKIEPPMNTTYETPSPEFAEKLSSFVNRSIEKGQWVLRCEDMELTSEEVSAQDGLLPLVVWVAGKTLEKIWGPQDLVFRCDSNATCGVVLEPQRAILPTSVWLHAVHYELERAVLSHDVSMVMNDWFNQWNDALTKKSILLLPPRPVSPQATNS